MNATRECEPLCEVTGKPCRWVCDEQFDDAGELVTWDAFCQDCMRWRDWSKDEAASPASEFSRPVCRRYFLGLRPLSLDALGVIFGGAVGGGKWSHWLRMWRAPEAFACTDPGSSFEASVT